MRLIDKAATDPDPEEEEDEDGGKDMESGERTPNGTDRDLSLREQYSPGHGPLFNGSAHLSTERGSQLTLYCDKRSSPSSVMVLTSVLEMLMAEPMVELRSFHAVYAVACRL